MTPGQAIQAGGLSILRNQIRRFNPDTDQATLVITRGGKQEHIHLNRPERREIREALDLHLSDRLLNLGVTEYDNHNDTAQPEAKASSLDRRTRSRPDLPPNTLRLRPKPRKPDTGTASADS